MRRNLGHGFAISHRSATKADAAGGFTLVELLMASVAAAVLVVTMGIMLVYGFTTWHRNTRSIDMHRDATLAMRTLDRALRQATALGVDLSQPDRIVVSNQVAPVLHSFYQQGKDLVYNPNLNNGGIPVTLVQGRVTPSGFTHSNMAQGVTIRLQLQEGTETLVMNGSVRFRN